MSTLPTHEELHDAEPHREFIRVPADLSKFWIITVLSNPQRYRRRYELYWRFAEACEQYGLNLITVEQAFGGRKFMVTRPDNKFHLQVRGHDEAWIKENLLNLGVKHACRIAPGQVKQIAWIDADCRSTMPNMRAWMEETWHELQHYEFVQMWEWLIDIDLNHNPIGSPQPGFMANYIKYGTPNPDEFRKIENINDANYPYSSKIFGRPGLAWAANIEALRAVGGFIDFCVLGSADWYMAHGLVGSLETARSEYAYGPYMSKLLEWQERAQRWIKRDVGFTKGTVVHDFHGRKALRFYGSRGKILRDCKFNPETDIKYDEYGVLQLETWEPRQIELRDKIRAYFRARDEDSTEL